MLAVEEDELVHSLQASSLQPDCSILAKSVENQDKILQVMLTEIDVK